MTATKKYSAERLMTVVLAPVRVGEEHLRCRQERQYVSVSPRPCDQAGDQGGASS